MRLGPGVGGRGGPGQFWKDYIRETAPVFRSTDRSSSFRLHRARPSGRWRDGARHVEPRLREIFDELQPDVVVEDNVVGFAAVVNGPWRWARIVSCHPGEDPDEKVPPAFSGLPTDDRPGWDEFRAEFRRVHAGLLAEFGQWMREQGARPCPTAVHRRLARSRPLISDPARARLSASAAARPALAPARVRAPMSEAQYELPRSWRRGTDASSYLSLGSLGSADVELMQRLVDVLAGHARSRDRLEGRSTSSWRPGAAHDGAEVLRPAVDLADGGLVLTQAATTRSRSASTSAGRRRPAAALDQYDNAERVHERPRARLDTYRFEPEELAEAIDRLSGDAAWGTLEAASHRLGDEPGLARRPSASRPWRPDQREGRGHAAERVQGVGQVARGRQGDLGVGVEGPPGELLRGCIHRLELLARDVVGRMGPVDETPAGRRGGLGSCPSPSRRSATRPANNASPTSLRLSIPWPPAPAPSRAWARSVRSAAAARPPGAGRRPGHGCGGERDEVAIVRHDPCPHRRVFDEELAEAGPRRRSPCPSRAAPRARGPGGLTRTTRATSSPTARTYPPPAALRAPRAAARRRPRQPRARPSPHGAPPAAPAISRMRTPPRENTTTPARASVGEAWTSGSTIARESTVMVSETGTGSDRAGRLPAQTGHEHAPAAMPSVTSRSSASAACRRGRARWSAGVASARPSTSWRRRLVKAQSCDTRSGEASM